MNSEFITKQYWQKYAYIVLLHNVSKCTLKDQIDRIWGNRTSTKDTNENDT